MLQLKPYRIMISGSTLDADFRAVVNAFSPFLTANSKEWLIRRSNKLDYVNDNRPPARRYEEDVRALLEAHIIPTEIGAAIFDLLPQDITIWIIPFDDLAQESFGVCNAVTGQMTSRLSDGVRILFSPETWAYTACGKLPGYRADETLLHEMVHACRMARFGADGINNQPLRMNKDHEEFLAVQMTNVYRSEKKAKSFNHAYLTSALGTQAEVERTLASTDFVTALESFSGDPLIDAVAAIDTPFNPFRDLARLKEQARLNQQPRPQAPRQQRK